MRLSIVIPASLCLTLSFALQAQEPDGADLYTARGCAGCHGADGLTPLMPNYPKVAGQNSDYTINQLNDFKSGKRKNGLASVMVGMVATLTDDDIQKLAEFLSGAKATGDQK